MLRAILRAQWLSVRGFRLGSSRRGALLSLITGVFWYGFWTVLAVATANFLANPAATDLARAQLPAGFLLVFLYWQLAPLITASMGASLDLRKLLAYPIPHRKLFLVEVLLRVTTAAEMLLIVAGASIGLVRNPALGGWREAPRAVAACVIFTLLNLLLSAGLRSLLERLLARKGLREALVLVLLLGTAVPRLLVASNVRLGTVRRYLLATESPIWPWTAASRLSIGPEAIWGATTLLAWTVLAWWFGRWQFERSLRYDAQAARATDTRAAAPEQSWIARLSRFPGLFLPDPLAAIIEKEVRTLSRTARFRLVFIMGFSFGILIWLPLVIGRHTRAESPLRENFLVLVSIYALTLLGQVSYWNAFGFDRSATQVYFSLPVPIRTALVGKNIAASVFIFAEIAAVTVVCLLLRVRIPGGKILESFAVVAIAALYMLGMGNLASVHYPRAMNPDRVSQGGASRRLQALIFVFFPLALLPVFLAYLARAVFESETMFLLILGFSAVLGVVVYWIAMDSAVEAARKRREEILAELARGEGPVVTE